MLTTIKAIWGFCHSLRKIFKKNNTKILIKTRKLESNWINLNRKRRTDASLVKSIVEGKSF